MIPTDWIEQVRESARLSEVINRYTPLDKYSKGICPFHEDKVPSLSINEKKGYWKCFGCGQGGDVFRFIMLKENIGFVEATRFLAHELGIPSVESDDSFHRHFARRRFIDRELRRLNRHESHYREWVENETARLRAIWQSLPKDRMDWNAKHYTAELCTEEAFEELDALHRVLQQVFADKRRTVRLQP